MDFLNDLGFSQNLGLPVEHNLREINSVIENKLLVLFPETKGQESFFNSEKINFTISPDPIEAISYIIYSTIIQKNNSISSYTIGPIILEDLGNSLKYKSGPIDLMDLTSSFCYFYLPHFSIYSSYEF